MKTNEKTLNDAEAMEEAIIILVASKIGYACKEEGLNWEQASNKIGTMILDGTFYDACELIQKTQEESNK